MQSCKTILQWRVGEGRGKEWRAPAQVRVVLQTKSVGGVGKAWVKRINIWGNCQTSLG